MRARELPLILIIHHHDIVETIEVRLRKLPRTAVQHVSSLLSMATHTCIGQLTHMPGADTGRIYPHLRRHAARLEHRLQYTFCRRRTADVPQTNKEQGFTRHLAFTLTLFHIIHFRNVLFLSVCLQRYGFFVFPHKKNYKKVQKTTVRSAQALHSSTGNTAHLATPLSCIKSETATFCVYKRTLDSFDFQTIIKAAD